MKIRWIQKVLRVLNRNKPPKKTLFPEGMAQVLSIREPSFIPHKMGRCLLIVPDNRYEQVMHSRLRDPYEYLCRIDSDGVLFEATAPFDYVVIDGVDKDGNPVTNAKEKDLPVIKIP